MSVITDWGSNKPHPGYNFDGWLLLNVPYWKCDTPACKALAPFMLPEGEATFFVCEKHLLELCKQ